MPDDQNQEVLSRLNIALRNAFRKRGVHLKSEMAKALGYKSPYFSGITTGKEKLTQSFLLNVSTKLGVSSTWILTGQGRMMLPTGKDEDGAPPAANTVPLVPLHAHGGSLTAFADLSNRGDFESVTSPIQGAEFAISVAGDSMAPEFPNGSIVLIQKIDADSFIEWGKPYVLDTRNGIVIKLLVPSEKNGAVKCVSINKDAGVYAPFDVPKDDIYGIYAVRFCMSRK